MYSQVKINQILSSPPSSELLETSKEDYFSDKQKGKEKRERRASILEYFMANGQPSQKICTLVYKI